MSNFHHGVETVEVMTQAGVVSQVSSSIIAIFGTSELANKNQLYQTTNFTQAQETYGAGTILDSIYRIHQYLPNHTIIGVPLGKESGFQDQNTDNQNSDIQNTSDENLEVDKYSFFNSKVKDYKLLEKVSLKSKTGKESSNPRKLAVLDDTNSIVVAFIDALPLLLEAKAQFGYLAKIHLAPDIIDKEGAALPALAMGNTTRGIWLCEPPKETSTKEEAKTFANSLSDYRAHVSWPRVEILAQNGDKKIDWFAPSIAGLIAQIDTNKTGETFQTGYWCSPSNYRLVDVLRPEYQLDYIINNPACDVNFLNSQGISSIINNGGLRLFGNRSAAFPFKTDVMTFLSWRRTYDIVEESIEYFTMQYMDRPMFNQSSSVSSTLLGQIQDSINDFLLSLVGTALIYGRCFLDPADNPETNLMQGIVKYRYQATPPMAMEKVEYISEIYVQALSDSFNQLFTGA